MTERSGGFSPGVAARLELSDGTSRFVKATSAELNPDSYRIYQMEAEIAGALPAGVPAPRLLGRLTVGSWIALLFEYVPGRPPREPWDDRELRAVLGLVAELPGLLVHKPPQALQHVEVQREHLHRPVEDHVGPVSGP